MSPSSISGAPILLATDLRDTARDALDCARQLASLRAAPVRAVHVIDLVRPTSAENGSFSTARDSAERRLRDIARELRLAGIPGVATLIAAGRPAVALRELAGQIQPQLLVMGRHRSSTLGATAKALLRNPPCPVLTVSTAARNPPFEHPLFVCDDSLRSVQAALAAWPSAHVPPLPALRILLPPGSGTVPRLLPELRHSFATLQTLASPAAPEAILQEAANCDSGLLVLSLQSGGPFDTCARGSLAHALLSAARCPVLSVRS